MRLQPIAAAALARLLAIATLAAATVACSKSNSPHSDAALPASDATVESEPSADLSAKADDTRTGIGGGYHCDASEECLTGACNLGVCSDWQHSMRIRIDTTSTGTGGAGEAGVSEAVTDFSLLIRLGGSANSFDFSQARGDGADIRFVDDKGHNLNYQIERWDSKRRLAELWVSVPRLLANSAANTITLYWGNQFAGPLASGTDVFDSYTCVYHIEDTGMAKQVLDDSGHNDIGSIEPSASPSTNNPEGVIGYGLGLDGKSNYLTTSSTLQSPPSLSISLWFNTQLGGSGGLAAFYLPGPARSDGSTTLALAMAPGGTLSFSVSHESAMVPVTSPISYDDHAWHLVTARLSASGQSLFVDGESVAENPTLTSADPSQDSFWRFGQLPGVTAEGVPSAYFGGVLDEIRVRGNAESAAWIKLSYATQRPGSSAVTYLPAQ